MIVVNDTAVCTDRYVNAGLLEVFVSLCCHIDNCGSLSTSDTLGLTGDTDGTAADTDLDKVCACVSQETEALAVNYVSGADLYGVTIVIADPLQGDGLPLGVTLGGVDNQYIIIRPLTPISSAIFLVYSLICCTFFSEI